MENFNKWRVLAKDDFQNGNKVKCYEIVKWYLISIANTGFIPQEGEPNAESLFLDDINSIYIPNILLREPKENQFDGIRSFIELCCQFGVRYGMVNGELSAIMVLWNIIKNKNVPLFQTQTGFYETIIQFCLTECEILDQIQMSVTFSAETFELLAILIAILKKTIKHVTCFDYNAYFRLFLERFSTVLARQRDIVPIRDIIIAMHHLSKCMPSSNAAYQDFANMVVPTFLCLCKSEKLEQRISALEQLSKYVEDARFSETVSTFLGSPANFRVLLADFHSSFAGPLERIMSALPKYVNITTDTVCYLWGLFPHMYSSDRMAYADVVLGIVNKHLSPSTLRNLVVSILGETIVNEEYLYLLSKLIPLLKSYPHSSDPYAEIRNMFVSGMFSDDPGIRSSARRYFMDRAEVGDFVVELNEVIGWSVKDPEFGVVWLDKFPDLSVVFGHDANRPKILGMAIDELVKKRDITEETLQLIVSLSLHRETVFDRRRFVHLLQIREKMNDFYVFLNKLLTMEKIDVGMAASVAMDMKPEEIDLSAYKFIMNIIKMKSTPGKYPIGNEELLWKWAIEPSEFSGRFAQRLCTLYAKVDKDVMSDKEMVTRFMEQWNLCYQQHRESPEVIELLAKFVETVEYSDNIDFSVREIPLSVEYSFPYYTIVVTFQSDKETIKVPKLALIGQVIMALTGPKEKWGAYDPSRITLLHEGRSTKITTRLANLVEPNVTEIHLTAILERTTLHRREYLPSDYLMDDAFPLVRELFTNLDKKGGFEVYHLLKALPCREMMNMIDFRNYVTKEDAFYHRKPQMTSLICQIVDILVMHQRDLDACRSLLPGLIQYVDKCLSSTEYTVVDEDVFRSFCRIMSYLFVNELQLITDKGCGEQVFFLLLRIVTVPRCFKESKDALAFLCASSLAFQLSIEDSSIYTCLMFHEKQHIREIGAKIFQKVSIPFEEIINNYDPEVTPANREFLVSVTSRVDYETPPQLAEAIFAKLNILIEQNDSSIMRYLFKLMNRLLKTMDMTNDEKRNILTRILNMFLTDEFDDRLLDGLKEAADCIVTLSEHVDIIRPVIEAFHTDRTPFGKFDIDGDNSTRQRITSRIGLCNLGSTCYLNTVLQQIYSITPLRDTIITTEYESQFMTHLSRLFLAMKESKAQYLSTKELVENYQPWEHERLVVTEQHDAAEYLNEILQRCEAHHLCESMYTGVQTCYFQGIKTGYQKQTHDPFTILSVEVKKSYDLVRALKAVIEPEISVSGKPIQVEEHGVKIDVTRTTCLTKCPPFLFLHLKRFRFGQESGNVKLDDVFEFPLELDMSPYCTERIPEYTLRGVIVHKGSAESGHYFTFVRENDVWIKIDDSKTSIVTVDEVIRVGYGAGNEGSGYILLYERPYTSEQTFSMEMVNSAHLAEIRQENKRIIEQTLFCSSGYFRLMYGLANIVSNDYHDIVLRYIIDSLMFSALMVSKSAKVCSFFDIVCKKCKYMEVSERQSFVDYLMKFINKLLDIGMNPDLYKHVVQMIESVITPDLDLQKLTDTVLRVFDGSSDLKKTSRVCSLFHSIAKNSEGKLDEKLKSMIARQMEAIEAKIKKRRYMYSEDLTLFMDVLYSVYKPKDVCVNLDFILFFASSRTDITALSRLASKHITKEKFRKEIENRTREPPACRSMELILRCASNPFQLIFRSWFRYNGDIANKAEISTMLITVLGNNPDLEGIYVEHCGSWLKIMLDDTQDVRNLAVSLVAYLIRSESFKRYSGVKWLDLNVKIKEPPFVPKPINAETQERAERIITKILEFGKQLLTKACSGRSFDDKFMDQYFIIVEELLPMISDLSLGAQAKFADLYSTLTKTASIPVSHTLVKLTKLCAQYNISLKQDILEDCVRLIRTKSDTSKTLDFIDYFLPVYFRGDISNDFISAFCEHIVFVSPDPTRNKHFNLIMDYTKKLCRSHTQFMTSLLKQRVTKWTVNLAALLKVFSFLRFRRDVAAYIEPAIRKNLPIHINEFAELVFEHNTGTLPGNAISAFLSAENLSEEHKAKLLNY